jgi:uncharacterized membrane protein YfbV (UPF0208 family)
VSTFVYTRSEVQAFQLMLELDGLLPNMTTTDPPSPHECANWFIEFAERIKAERAVAAMETIP